MSHENQSFFNKLKFYFKLSLITVIFLSFLIISLSYSVLLFPLRHRLALPAAFFSYYLVRLFGFSYELKNIQNIPEKGAIVILNHQCLFDLVVVGMIWPHIERGTTVIKKETLLLPGYGLINYIWGSIYIDRSNVTAARKSLSHANKLIKELNTKLFMFPEGTRNESGTLLPFKKGAFHIAIETEAPIVCVVISKYWQFSQKQKIFGRGKLIARVLPPIQTKGLTIDDLPQLIEKTRNLMQDEFNELSNESNPKRNILHNNNVN